MDQLLLPHGMTLTMFDDVGTVSDGHHTFNELYQHRSLLFCLLLRREPHAWKSRLHDDGTALEGWFIAGTTLHCGYEDRHGRYTLQKAVTYHLPDALWVLCQAKELPKAPPWDGHTSLEVLDRLRRDLDGTLPREARGARATTTEPRSEHTVGGEKSTMGPEARPIHYATLVRRDGAVSPLCAPTPRKINLKVASWTNRRDAVTCEACLAALATHE